MGKGSNTKRELRLVERKLERNRILKLANKKSFPHRAAEAEAEQTPAAETTEVSAEPKKASKPAQIENTVEETQVETAAENTEAESEEEE